MTMHDDIERVITGWLFDAATPRAVELDDVFAQTRSMQQRPAWASPGRWLPMQLTMPRVAVPRALPILAVIALLIAALLVAVLIAGSQQRRLPPPFGVAATGLFVYDSGGDVFVANPDGTGVRPLITGPGDELGATFSRDGRYVAYWSIPPDGPPELWVSAADGSAARKVSGDIGGPRGEVGPAADWSPRGDRLAFAALERIHVVDADGTDLHTVSAADGAFGPAWSPDGSTIAFKGTVGGETAVFVVGADGMNERRVSTARGVDLSHMWPSWSPDGRALAYHVSSALYSDVAVTRFDGSTWTETIVVGGATLDYWPEWSNDGTRISFHRAASRDHGYLVIADVDGSSQEQLASRLIGWAPHCWTPDDRSIVAATAQEDVSIGDEADPGFVIVDVDGSGKETFIPTPGRTGFAACSWQRLAVE